MTGFARAGAAPVRSGSLINKYDRNTIMVISHHERIGKRENIGDLILDAVDMRRRGHRGHYLKEEKP